MNNDGSGAIKPKSGDNLAAINRAAGMAQALGAVTNKTRSGHKGSSKHNHYEGCGGYGDNENILGYGKHG